MALVLSSPSPLAPQPSWFTPKRLLAIFCIINLLNYVDRGVIASNGVNGSPGSCSEAGICSSGTGIQGEFNLNNFKDGVISSAFMVGLLLASPIFASLAKSVNPFRLIGVGLTVWTLATAGCGFSVNFWSITIFRMFVGVGEASFISLAAPFIDDNAPVEQKSAWLGVFYMCIPTGVAFGYVYGGLVGTYLTWHWAFWIEAVLMLPFAILGFLMKPLQLKGSFSHSFAPILFCTLPLLLPIFGFTGFSPTGSENVLTSAKTACLREEVTSTGKDGSIDYASKAFRSKGVGSNAGHFRRVLKDMGSLLGEKIYVVNVLGYIAYNFVIGAYSYWGPKAGYNIYQMSNADLLFGSITVVCGIFGTLAGGFVLDLMTATLPNAFKLLSVATFFGAIFCFAAFCFKSLYAFIALFAIGELLVFATQGPVNYVCLHSVKPNLRPLSMAISTVSIHIFGDVPSSPLVGVLQDHVNNWRISALVLTSVLFLAAGIWFIGIFVHGVDRFYEDSEEQSSTTSLLEEHMAERVESSA